MLYRHESQLGDIRKMVEFGTSQKWSLWSETWRFAKFLCMIVGAFQLVFYALSGLWLIGFFLNNTN